ncbi:hypothetical protein GLX27_000035 [Malassezia furfur]|uniref:Uncharacterized protein n=1 Tax=Malassezia furfur TaxID=55194 RepID=A0ABY8EHU2_MALFU|nr:hypothetical protein GLX27_000035 [Malassezia furfur]
MSLAAPVPVSDASTTLLLKYSKTTLFLTVVLSTTSVRELKARALAALAASAQPDDDHVGRPFADVSPDDVEVYVGTPGDTDAAPMQFTPLQASKPLGKTAYAQDESARLDALALDDGAVLYLGFPGEPHVQLPSLDDEVVEGDA